MHVSTFKQTEQSIDAYRKEGAMRDGRHSTHMCLGLVVAAIVTTSLSKTPADLLTTLGTPTVVAAQTGNENGDKPKGTVWVVNRDLGQLAIFDAATGDLLTTPPLAVGRGAHDICISEQAHKAYLTADTDNVVTVVDTDTLATESIAVGPLPHHLEPANDGHTIYVSLASHPTTPPFPRKNECAR